MITIAKLIAALIAIISLVNQSPSLTQQEKTTMVNQIISAVGQANGQQAVAPTSTTLIGGPNVQDVSAPRKASQGKLSSLVIGGLNADDTKTVSWASGDAAWANVTLYAQAKRGWEPLYRQTPSKDGQSLFQVDRNTTYRWEVVSRDGAGASMGTTTGQFFTGDN